MGILLLVLFTESLDIRFAVRIEEVLAALLHAALSSGVVMSQSGRHCVSSPAADGRQRRLRKGAAVRRQRNSYTKRNVSFAVACDDDHTKRDLADMLRTFGFLRKQTFR